MLPEGPPGGKDEKIDGTAFHRLDGELDRRRYGNNDHRRRTMAGLEASQHVEIGGLGIDRSGEQHQCRCQAK